MKLTDVVLRNFRVAKVFRENTDRINSLDFSPNGETLISSSDDDSIVIYDCQNGTLVYCPIIVTNLSNTRAEVYLLPCVLGVNYE